MTRTAVSFGALLVLGLLAGCLAPQEEPEEDFRLENPATLECGRLSIEAPESMRANEVVEVRVRLQNVCASQFQIQGTSLSCSPSGLNVRLLHGEEIWFLTGAAAVPHRLCSLNPPVPQTIEPGAELVETFVWNGSFDASVCRSATCPAPPQPPTSLVLEAYVVLPDLGFIAQTDVRYLP